MKKLMFLLAGLAFLGITGRFSAREIEADPAKDYYVYKEVGPWMVCVTSYTGEDAAKMAHDLTLEIRQKYQLPAFIVNRGAEERLKEQERIRRIRETCPEGARIRTLAHMEEHFAVLIGGYKDMESARAALDVIKKLKPPADRFCILGDRVVPGTSEKGEKGVWVQQIKLSPFTNSFVARNPTFPAEQTQDNKPDPFLKELNRGESLSLLKCPKTWTLAVKSFQGMQAIQQSVPGGNSLLDVLGMGNKTGETLNAGALQAHELGELLRRMKFEAYVLHTRNSSVVCVGGFDSRNDPRLVQTQQTLAKLKFEGAQQNMQLFAQPLPMEVPKP
ncbi:MAG: hypothetical protein K2R98_10050 [Gemmataceae bacterium]|nr:hypothetical protein [Gemmataceae bacterium]